MMGCATLRRVHEAQSDILVHGRVDCRPDMLTRARHDGAYPGAFEALHLLVIIRGACGAHVKRSFHPIVYCASHKNWIRNIRFGIINRLLSQ